MVRPMLCTRHDFPSVHYAGRFTIGGRNLRRFELASAPQSAVPDIRLERVARIALAACMLTVSFSLSNCMLQIQHA